MRLRTLLAVLVLALLAAPACGSNDRGDDGFRLELDGKARVTSTKGARTVTAGKHSLASGDIVRMLDGDAVLGLPGDRSLWLRADGSDSSIVKVATTPDVIDGDAVVLAGSDDVHFTAGAVDVRLAPGAARVHRGLGVTVAVYRGSADVGSAGRALSGGLAALRQVSIPATGMLPRRPVPLIYDAATPDPWDLRFLGDAIDLGRFLDTEARGFTSQIGPRASVDAAVLQRILPPLATETSVPVKLASTHVSAGEALVGSAIVVESGRGSFDDRWDDVFSFREAGARWGLVALDQQVKRDALKGRLRDALGRSPVLFAAGPSRPSSGRTTTQTQVPPSGGSGGRTSTTTTPPTAPPTTAPGPTVPPTTVPPTTTPPTTAPPITLPPIIGGSQSDPNGAPTTEPAGLVDHIVDLLVALISTSTTLRLR